MDPITAGILAAGAGGLGTMYTNQQQIQQSEEGRKWQQMMASTAHEREVNDLRAAGLNPILSALGGGASAPGTSVPSLNDMGPGISKGMDTAIAVRGQNKELEAKDASIKNLKMDTANKDVTNSLLQNQISATAQDIRQKSIANRIMSETADAQIKKALAEGNYAEINQLMGVINAGASSANSLLNPLNKFFPGKK